jgi:hypothetical protein
LLTNLLTVVLVLVVSVFAQWLTDSVTQIPATIRKSDCCLLKIVIGSSDQEMAKFKSCVTFRDSINRHQNKQHFLKERLLGFNVPLDSIVFHTYFQSSDPLRFPDRAP